MINIPQGIETADLALRISTSRGASAYFTYLVDAKNGDEVLEDLDAELHSLDEAITLKTLAPLHADAVLEALASTTEEILLIDARAFHAPDWRHLDLRRSSLGRDGVMVFVTTPGSFDELMQSAPNLASWLGGFVFSHEDEAARMADARDERLKILRNWLGKTDEEVVRAAQDGTLPRDPEFAEWLVLLGRGDLLDA